MASPVNRLIFTLRNNKGKIFKVAVLIAAAVLDPDGAVVAAIRAALQLLTGAKVEKTTIAVEDSTKSAPASAAYGNIEDRAAMFFIDVQGQIHRYWILAPKVTNFIAGTDQVNQLDPNVATYIAAMIAGVQPKDGLALASFKEGWRHRGKTQKS